MSGGVTLPLCTMTVGGTVPLFNPSHQSRSTVLSYRAIQGLRPAKVGAIICLSLASCVGVPPGKVIVRVDGVAFTSGSRDALCAVKEHSPFSFSHLSARILKAGF